MAEESVDVLDPSGQLGSVPKSQLSQALQLGYQPATAQDIKGFENAKEFGTSGQAAKAFLEGAGRDTTFGLSTWIEKKLGVDPEAIKQRQEQNPAASTLGGLFGIGASVLAPIATPIGLVGKGAAGIASKALPGATRILANPGTATAAQKILSSAGTVGLGSAIEGAAFGAGQSVHEAALGDPDAMGENLLHNVGYGALIGGGIGAAIGGVGGYRALKKMSPEAKAEAEKELIKENANKVQAPINEETLGILPDEALPDAVPVSPPRSIQEIEEINQRGRAMGFETETPTLRQLDEAIELTPDVEIPIHQVQREAILDPEGAGRNYKVTKESNTPEGKILRENEIHQKQEAILKTEAEINKLNPEGHTPTLDPVEAGLNVPKIIETNAKNEAERLKPIFQQIDEASKVTPVSKSTILDEVRNVLPDIDDHLLIGENGVIKLKPFDATSSIERSTYKALKDIVQGLNKEELNISQLRNIRSKISSLIKNDGSMSNMELSQLGGLKKRLMDIMQSHIQKTVPELEVREAFKGWAINEEKRELLKSLIGKEPIPEKISDRLFSNSVSIKDAKELLGKDFNKILADYLHINMQKVTDSTTGIFSSAKWKTFLKNKDIVLREAFADNPVGLDRIKAFKTRMQLIPDSAPSNPSGTADKLTLLNKMAKVGSLLLDPVRTIAEEGKKFVTGKVSDTLREREINKILSKSTDSAVEGKAAKAQALGNMERMKSQTQSKIVSGAKKVFTGIKENKETISAVAGQKLTPKEEKKELKKKHKDLSANLNNFMNDPEKLIDALHNATDSLYEIAPQVSGGLQMALARATQFLGSKVPQTASLAPLSPEMEPSDAEIAKFNRYYEVVKNPLVAMNQLQGGSLTSETIETLSTVYPKLYSDMRVAVMDEMTNFIAKKDVSAMPYRTKLSLSMFLGQDLTQSLAQPSIASNQMVLAGNGQQQVQNQMDQKVRTSQDGLSKLSLANNALTPMQKSQMRMS